MSNQDYQKAKQLGLTSKDRFNEGIENHPNSVRLVEFLAEHDFHDYNDYFCWKVGGDGDNGQTLAFQMDAFFELLDAEQANTHSEETYMVTSNWRGAMHVDPMRIFTDKQKAINYAKTLMGGTPKMYLLSENNPPVLIKI